MKKFLKIIFAFYLVFSCIIGDDAYSSTPSQQHKAKPKVKSSSNKSRDKKIPEEAVIEDSEISEAEQCLIDNISVLLNSECQFLNDNNILSTLKDNFYCVYNYKERNKIDSVYNYYLYQNYGIREESLKDDDMNVTIKNPGMGSLKGGSKYYDVLLDGLKNGDLNDGKILDFITEDVLWSSNIQGEDRKLISKVSVETAVIVTNVTKKNIEQCRKATKSIINSCGATADSSIQAKINTSCEEYNTALVKETSTKKAELFSSKDAILKVLLNRAKK